MYTGDCNFPEITHFPYVYFLCFFPHFPSLLCFFFYSSLFDTCMHACIGGLVATPLASVV